MDLLDPWSAVNAKLPSIGETCTSTAHYKTYVNLTANASGNLCIYFDPDYINASAGTYSTLFYCNNSALDGVTPVSGAGLWTTSVAAPTPPATTVLKYRLVSAGMKIVPKMSNLNYVATALCCLDYGDIVPTGALSACTPTSAQAAYTTFLNALNQVGGVKYDLAATGQAIYFNWYPTDPYSEIFIDPADYVVDNQNHEIGGSPKFVCCLQDLYASSKVDVEIVWNIEYLPTPTAKPWLGITPGSSMTPSQLDQLRTMDLPKISLGRAGAINNPPGG